MKAPKAQPRPLLAGVEFSLTTRRTWKRSQGVSLLLRVCLVSVHLRATCDAKSLGPVLLGLPIGRSAPKLRFPPRQDSTARP